jgi:hypothetical protein
MRRLSYRVLGIPNVRKGWCGAHSSRASWLAALVLPVAADRDASLSG